LNKLAEEEKKLAEQTANKERGKRRINRKTK